MNQNKRSSHFDYFTNPHGQEPKDEKRWFRRSLFILKISFLIILAGLTLTGCIQSFVVRSDSQVGRGLEFYTEKDKVAPLAPLYSTNTPSQSDGSISSSERSPQLGNTSVNFVRESNVLVSSSDTIQKLINQVGPSYGQNDTFTTSLALAFNDDLSGNAASRYIQLNIDSEGQETFTNNNQDTVFKVVDSTGAEKFLAFNSEAATYTRIFDNYSRIFAFSRSSNQFVTNQPFDIARTNEDGTPEVPPTDGTRRFSILRPFFYEVTLGDNPNNAALYNRDVLESFYRLMISKNIFRNIKDVNGSSQSVEQFFAWLQNQGNYTSRILATPGANGISSVVEVAEVTESQKAAFDAFTRFNTLINQTYFNQANNSTQILQSDPNSASFFTSSGSPTQQSITNFSEAWSYGPFFALIVFPIQAFANAILAGPLGASSFGIIAVIILIVFVSRFTIFILSFRTIFTQQKIQELNVRKAQIEAKYAKYDKNNKVMKQRKARETQQMFKKNGVNQFDTFLQIFYTTPIFLASWRIISAIPIIKSNTFAGVSFAATSWQQLVNNQQFQYLPLMIIALVMQLTSQFLPRFLQKKRLNERTNVFERETLKKTNKTQNIIAVVFSIITLLFQAGIQIYWILGAIWTISQTLFAHYFQRSSTFKRKIKPLLDRPKIATWRAPVRT